MVLKMGKVNNSASKAVTDESVRLWLGRVAPKTAEGYRERFIKFMAWLKEQAGPLSEMSPDDLIEYQRNTDNDSRYDILDKVQEWVSAMHHLRLNSKKASYAAVRSFFLHNRIELPRDKSFRIRSDVPAVQGTLSLEEVRKVILASNECYQAVFTAMFQGALDRSGFDYWNRTGWESLKEQLREEADVVKIDLPGRKKEKNRRPFYTFIGGDAIKAIRKYLEKRPNEKSFSEWERNREERCREDGVEYRPRTLKADFIFYTKDMEPVSSNSIRLYWLRKTKRLGLVQATPGGPGTRYGKNPHEMRDLWRTQFMMSRRAPEVAEFLMGHVVDPNRYVKVHRNEAWALQEYREALPWLQLMSSSMPYGQVDQIAIDKLTQDNRELASEIESLHKQLQGVPTRELTEQLLLAVETISELRKRLDDLEERGERV